MSYFDNIVFDENTLLEGEQAEAYKAKKAAEKDKSKLADEMGDTRRYYENSASKYKYRNDVGDRFVIGKGKNRFVTNINDGERAQKADNIIINDTMKKVRNAVNANNAGDTKKGEELANQQKRVIDNEKRVKDAINRHMRRHPKQYPDLYGKKYLKEALEAYDPEFIEL